MNINATLLVQIGNFYIFYVLIRYFLFKPAVAVIDHENSQMAKLAGVVDQQIKSIAIKKKEHQQFWGNARDYFKTHRPFYALNKKRDFFTQDSMPIDIPSDEDLATLVAHISKELGEKIKHVH